MFSQTDSFWHVLQPGTRLCIACGPCENAPLHTETFLHVCSDTAQNVWIPNGTPTGTRTSSLLSPLFPTVRLGLFNRVLQRASNRGFLQRSMTVETKSRRVAQVSNQRNLLLPGSRITSYVVGSSSFVPCANNGLMVLCRGIRYNLGTVDDFAIDLRSLALARSKH